MDQDLSRSRPPPCRLFVPPAPVTEVRHGFPVRATACFAAAFRALEANPLGQFRPIDRIEPAAVFADRHQTALPWLRAPGMSSQNSVGLSMAGFCHVRFTRTTETGLGAGPRTGLSIGAVWDEKSGVFPRTPSGSTGSTVEHNGVTGELRVLPGRAKPLISPDILSRYNSEKSAS